MRAQTRLRVAYKLLASTVAEYSRLGYDLPLVIKEPHIHYLGDGWAINNFAYRMRADEIIGLWDAQNRALCEQIKFLTAEPDEKVKMIKSALSGIEVVRK